MYTLVVVPSNAYVQCGGHIQSEAYASNVKCMYNFASGHTVGGSEFV